MNREDSLNHMYLCAMNETIGMVIEFAEHARNADDDVKMGAYLKMASRAMRCALEIYGDHLTEVEQGEKAT